MLNRGVILYGMVVGQLPFVTVRENNMTSQERRKKLLEQINKGIAPQHRKAMTLFSNEFKGMIGRLLVPDATKRITIKELIFHPWITEKGRKTVRSNPLKKLDRQHQGIVSIFPSPQLIISLSFFLSLHFGITGKFSRTKHTIRQSSLKENETFFQA